MQINPAHWHLLINHFPIILSIVGTLFLGLGLVLSKNTLKTSGLLLLILGALTAIPTNQTGEGAEEVVEEIPTVTLDGIEVHEEAAGTGLTIILITGGIALITALMQLKYPKQARIMLFVALIAGITSAGFMSYVGLTGGEIRHSEIRGDLNRGSATNAIDIPANNNAESDDDD